MMTVPVGSAERERPCQELSNVVTMKRVKGQLLRREESYTEALSFEDQDAGGEDDGDGVVLTQYTLKTQRSVEKSSAAPNIAAAGSPALRRNVRAWCDATGLPTTVTIRFTDRVFHLHKFPLVSRSGYLKRALRDAVEVTLVLPGGSETFELVSNFCYGSTILMEPANVAELCCAANSLEMTEEYGRANLFERSELYLTQVALQSWDDTLVVLEHCERLAPLAERLGIVRRCLDALAFMSCMELLDPVTSAVKQSSAFQWWMQDLVALPPHLFVKLVLALRREGMQENYVGQVITAFTDRWIFGNAAAMAQKLGHEWEPAVLIEFVVGLLPLERGVVPIGFLFALLRRGLTCGLNDDCRIQLETRIVLQLETATLHDVLLPGKKERETRCVLKSELESMERILKLFLTRFRAFDDPRASDMEPLTTVTKLWDAYLTEIAFDSSITPARFTELVERIPDHLREVHDEVYRAVHTYLKAHPSATQEDRLTVCRTLNCQKLSQEACAHAVQNDLMPLRMIVQAMFTQQLQTRSVLNSHLESAAQSFREPPDSHSHDRNSVLPNWAPLALTCEDNSFRPTGNDLYIDDAMYAAASDNKAVKKEPAVTPYHATESRIRSLEVELSRMRKTLSQSLIESAQNRAPEDSNPSGYGVVPLTSRSATPSRMATVPESAAMAGTSCGGGSGCMSQLKPVSGTTGLLARTLQKLKLRSFGRSAGAVAVNKVHTPRLSAAAPMFESDMCRLVARTDSMPRAAVKPRHSRRNSMS